MCQLAYPWKTGTAQRELLKLLDAHPNRVSVVLHICGARLEHSLGTRTTPPPSLPPVTSPSHASREAAARRALTSSEARRDTWKATEARTSDSAGGQQQGAKYANACVNSAPTGQ
jgi:hypothetical protein